MNAIIFQVGLLAFFVAAVLFGIQGMSVIDMVARAFMVFIAVVAGQAVIIMVLGSMRKGPPASASQPQRRENADGAGREDGGAPAHPATDAP